MSAISPTPHVNIQAMTSAWLDAVLALEQQLYPHPWSRGNFADALIAGYQAQVVTVQLAADAPAHLMAYLVAMMGVDEVHLLNIAVEPLYQKQGWARVMLDGLAVWAREHAAQRIWLEVRVSNTNAQAMYKHLGYEHVSVRRNYYPAARGQREDALVMSLVL